MGIMKTEIRGRLRGVLHRDPSSALEPVIESLAASQIQNSAFLSEFQTQAAKQHEKMLEQM